MGVQEIVAIAIVGAALAYIGRIIFKMTNSFSSKAACTNDCGCTGKTEKPHIVA